MATARKLPSTSKATSKTPVKTAAKPQSTGKRVKPNTTKPSTAKPVAADPVGSSKTIATAGAPTKVQTSNQALNVIKPKKPKLVRDSFTIPKAEYEAIEALKLRASKLGQAPKKSELLRAGLKALSAMNDQALKLSIAAVPSIKTGRPAA